MILTFISGHIGYQDQEFISNDILAIVLTSESEFNEIEPRLKSVKKSGLNWTPALETLSTYIEYGTNHILAAAQIL